MNIISVDEAPNYDQQNQLHHMQIHQPQGEIYVTAISTMNPTMVSTVSDMPPKISPPNNELRIEPPQHAQPPTFYVMSPHPHLAPATPQHNPFANMGPPPPQSPAPSLTSQISSPSNNANLKSQNGLKDSRLVCYFILFTCVPQFRQELILHAHISAVEAMQVHLPLLYLM